MLLDLGRRTLDLRIPQVMGVLNVTPDSFSDGGLHATLGAAVDRAATMVAEGATLIDVGDESTRPGAQPVPEQLELDRVIPVVEALSSRFTCVVSVDTMKAAVMRAACAAGAELINDVNGLRADGAIEAARDSGVAVCLVHMQGEPRTMQREPRYHDVLAEVQQWLAERIGVCVAAGIPRQRLLADPGFGFGKRVQHNLCLLAHLGRLRALEVPMLVGLSRKSMYGELLGRAPTERVAASVAAAAWAVSQGAHVVRAHDIAATVDAVRLVHALLQEQYKQGSKHEETVLRD